MTVIARNGGRTLAQATLTRDLVASDLASTPVRGNGLYGTFFSRAPSAAPRSAVLVLGGSAGGLADFPAALLASHGYPALSLA